jgi:antitoxin component YwqK of YwqJK toxin-antitoxin module
LKEKNNLNHNMKKIFQILGIAILTVSLFSCGDNAEKTEIEIDKSEEVITSKREIKPGEMYHDVTYYEDGVVKMEGNMIDGKKEGKWMAFFEDGMPWSETYFENGISVGPTTAWHSSGKKYYEGNYKDGKRSGNWKFFNEDGTLEKEENY